MTDIMEIYAQERERMEKELETVQDIKEAADKMSISLDRMRMAYRTRIQDAALRKKADQLFDVAKQAMRCMLAISGAEVKVVQDEQATVTVADRLVAMLPMAAMIVGAVLTVWMIFEDLNVPAGLAMVLTCIAWLETQVVYRRRLGVAARPKINVYEMLRMIDRLMEAIEDALEKSAQEIKAAEEPSCEAPTMGGDVLEVFQMLLEAAQTKDGEYALKAVPGLRSALLAQGIEAVDYCEEKKEWFDLYPGTEGGLTIRPALMQGGKMIRRGQATEEME